MNNFAYRLTFLITLFLFIITGCSGQSATYENVNVDEAREIIDQGNVVVLDVRTKAEYDEGHIPGAKLYPLQEIEEWSKEIDLNQEYVVVCRSGNRSTQASQYLSENGFQNLYNMTGGMNQWKFDIEK